MDGKSQMGNQDENKSDEVTFCFFGGSSGFIGLEIMGLFLHSSPHG
jgi:hypothetical protein